MARSILSELKPAGRPMLTPVPLALCCGLAILSLALATFARLTDVGVLRMPPTPVLEYRELAFRDLSERGVEVIDPTTGTVLTRLARSEGGGFVQNVLSGMNVDRKRQGTPGEAPYRIARHADGRLYLNDPSTGRRQTVDAFGATQTAVFARLLAGGATTQGDKR